MGAIVEGYQYDAYGRQTVFSAGPSGAVEFGGDDAVNIGGVSEMSNPYLYTGRRLDGESELYFYRHRYQVEWLGNLLVKWGLNGRLHTEDFLQYAGLTEEVFV